MYYIFCLLDCDACSAIPSFDLADFLSTAAARALYENTDLDARTIAERAMKISAGER